MRSLLAAALASVVCACAAPAQTLDQAIELRATGQVRGEYLELEQWLRETVEP